ncbi:hypothetical protein [Alteromonas stellipolaris]|uniref:hypothetical protein n=1 Tax=Alteromonas stellipolaris TaxID=233316 RepID=UPI002733E227|nr:hypothetical protein [Alteromonas stellipolaris]MDP2596400.1 hypothetical protein [Alteromonas stellipolaris]
MTISVGDVEKISKLSGVLVIPLIAAALYTQFGWWAIGSEDSLLAYMESDNKLLSITAKVFAFVVSVTLVTFAYFLFSALTGHYSAFRVIAALSLLTFGILGLGAFTELLVQSHENIKDGQANLYLHLASLAWGFEILNAETVGDEKEPK